MDYPICQREDLEIELEHMEWSNFTTVVDKLGNGENITLTYEVIRYGARIGCDVVNVGRLDRQFRPNLKRPDAKKERKVNFPEGR